MHVNASGGGVMDERNWSGGLGGAVENPRGRGANALNACWAPLAEAVLPGRGREADLEDRLGTTPQICHRVRASVLIDLINRFSCCFYGAF